MKKINKVAVSTTIFPMKEAYLFDFFESLTKQDCTCFDIIVLNDGYGSIDKFISLYPKLNIIELIYTDTPAKNREYSLNYIKNLDYEVIIFGDSDDYFKSNRVSHSINLLSTYDIVVNDVSLFSENDIYQTNYMSNRIPNNSVITSEFIRDKNVFGLSNTAILTNSINDIDKINFDENLIALDWYFFSMLLAKGKKAIFTSDTCTYYRQHENNTVGLNQISASSVINIINIKKAHYKLAMDFDNRLKSLHVIFDELSQKISNKTCLSTFLNNINNSQKFPLWWELSLKAVHMKLTEKKEIYNYCKPYIIAELGANHNGDMSLARELILQAKEAGADCVKFQSWTKDSVFSKKKYDDNYFIADDYRDRTDYTLEEIVEAYSISESELLEMKAFADEVGIDCTSTPFSPKEADFLVDKMETPFIKVASMDLNNFPFLEYLARKGKPMVISTGLSELYEIDQAIKTIENAGNSEIVILHCVSTYPPEDSDVNLHNIKTLMTTYPDYPVGFSDHTLGTTVPLAAAALGACLIEKHFTLDKSMEGWDHKVSATKEEMAEIVENSSRIAKALGSFRISAPESDDKKREFRRSIVITRNMKKGDEILKDDIDYKRPGGGLDPSMTDFLIGHRVNRDLAFDHVLTKNDII